MPIHSMHIDDINPETGQANCECLRCDVAVGDGRVQLSGLYQWYESAIGDSRPGCSCNPRGVTADDVVHDNQTVRCDEPRRLRQVTSDCLMLV